MKIPAIRDGPDLLLLPDAAYTFGALPRYDLTCKYWRGKDSPEFIFRALARHSTEYHCLREISRVKSGFVVEPGSE